MKVLANSATGMLLDGIFASEAIDSSGEILSVSGADITDFEEGKGIINYEHADVDKPGASPNDIIGKILSAKKITKESDCKDDRQKMYWKQLELPFIYGIVRLYDAAGHPGAIAAAAQIRDHVANGEQILCRWSIEGSTLKKEGQRLVHTVARRVALTLRPCNRSCNTGLLLDPNAPAGFDKEPNKVKLDLLAEIADAKKSERRPDALILGGYVNDYSLFTEDDLAKATTAGSGNVAPGSLSGGAALQIEDPGLRKRYLVNVAKGAYRDWDKVSDFKKFLKFRLPEADESFIDRFSDMVDDFRLKKGQNPLESPTAAVVAKMKKPLGEDDIDHEAIAKPLTLGGQRVQETPLVATHFDENTGTLHTPRGSFPMYIPGRDPSPSARESFHNLMQEPQASKVHSYAFKNWKKANRLLAAGKLPESVIMHASLFSQLSPNTPVPMQEMMYGHLVDTMREHGIDARDPNFTDLKQPWLSSSDPNAFPQHSRGHFEDNAESLRLKGKSKHTGRSRGQIGGFMLANDKFKNMSQYHLMHEGLRDLVGRHGVDAQSAVRELLLHKKAGQAWEAREKNRARTGKPSQGPFPGYPVRGLAPKTARYMYSMMGGGNTVVPDTHFIRHLFGLHRNVDTGSINYLKSLLWNENNAPVLEGIDRYYNQNHDAVKHMAAHPDAQGLSQDQLNFPAFWRHWMTIVPHEQSRGQRSSGYNKYTDHRPFWEAIAKDLETKPIRKAEQDAWAQAQDSVKQHLDWHSVYGEGPAMIMFFTHLLPQLLASEPDDEQALGEDAPVEANQGEPNGDRQELVQKFERMAMTLGAAIDGLRKAEGAVADPRPNFKEAFVAGTDPGVVNYQGKKVKPGHLTTGQEHFSILGQDKTHFHVLPTDNKGTPVKSWGPGDVQKVSKLGKDSWYQVHRHPETVDAGTKVDAKTHGDPRMNIKSSQHKLIHGLDFGAEPIRRLSSARVEQRVHPEGYHVFVKGDNRPTGFTEPRREVAYHNLAHDVFGLGHMVPDTALVHHPKTGAELSVQRHSGGTHYGDMPGHRASLIDAGDRGDLDKAGIMNQVLGNWDRHSGNWMMTGDKKNGFQPKLIDHGISFNDNPSYYVEIPDYLSRFHGLAGIHDIRAQEAMPIHPAARQWLNGLDEKKLVKSMTDMGIPAGHIYAAEQRLKYLKAINQGEQLRLGDVFDRHLIHEPGQGLRREEAP